MIQPSSGQYEAYLEEQVELGLSNLADGTAICLKCQRTFSTVGQAKVHYKEIHTIDPNDKRWMCHVCRKCFAIKRYLNNHMRAMHGLTQSIMKNNYVPS